MNWIQSVLMGFAVGLSEPMALSADAHRGLLRTFFGVDSEGPLFLLFCHSAILAVLLAAGRLELGGLRRTAKQLRLPKRRRSAHPNLNQAGTLRLLRQAWIPAVLGRLVSGYFGFMTQRLWLLGGALVLGGLLMWIPSLMRTANKDGRHLSPADGLLMGLGAMTGAVPGFSFVGGAMTVASVRGVRRSYALRFAWILLCAGLAANVGLDLLTLIGSGFQFEMKQILWALLGGAAAAAGAYLSIHAMLALTRPAEDTLSGFSFYNWGLALLCFALFLLV